MPRLRDYSELPARSLVRAEIMLPAALMRRLYRVAAKHRAVVRGKDQVVQEVLEAFLEKYEADVLLERQRSKDGK